MLVAKNCLHAMKIMQVQTAISVTTPYVLKTMMVGALSMAKAIKYHLF